jgi:hypothetical protein
MLIGGFALAAYGQIRATQDIDMAIAASCAKSAELETHLEKSGYQVSPKPDPAAPVFLVTDLKLMLEVEMWTKPDGVVFDTELMCRRVRVNPYNDDFEMFTIGPEDFIVNKLARRDRGVQDELDAVSVLELQKGKLDYPYLRHRAKQADIIELLETLMQKSGTNIE